MQRVLIADSLCGNCGALLGTSTTTVMLKVVSGCVQADELV